MCQGSAYLNPLFFAAMSRNLRKRSAKCKEKSSNKAPKSWTAFWGFNYAPAKWSSVFGFLGSLSPAPRRAPIRTRCLGLRSPQLVPGFYVLRGGPPLPIFFLGGGGLCVRWRSTRSRSRKQQSEEEEEEEEEKQEKKKEEKEEGRKT